MLKQIPTSAAQLHPVPAYGACVQAALSLLICATALIPAVANAGPSRDNPKQSHWAYQAPVRPALPVGPDLRNPIDAFITARLADDSLELAPPAPAEIVLRRLSLSLIGLPPTLEELDSFLAAYNLDPMRAIEAAADRLLASPAFGERWARPWLDAARYADSHGFQRDDLRDIWLYRDWVIRALNENMPFDQFTIHQLAGDLLVNKPLDADLAKSEMDLLIATGFHRCTPANVEAGTDQEEGRVNQVFDRVNTTATVWLGTTLECAQCHDHKYDPLTIRDYYSFFAFFNNTPQETAFLNAKAQASLRFTGPYFTLPGETVITPDEQEEQSKVPDGSLPRKKGDIQHHRRTLVMQELTEPRLTRILKRGNFLDPGEPVTPAIPSHLPFLENAPANRLGLAQWLVSTNNPLTARVMVNRLWAELFGRGLVSTAEDFGKQGEPATHPQLLDWLAVEYVESGWDTKRLLRLIVTSQTFQQSASRLHSPKAASIDPDNKLLWHYPRMRLDAEGIRDSTLAISGLLSRKQWGPPIRPAQPEGLWRKVGGENYIYRPSPGEDRYRRGIYVIRRRSASHPTFAAFDAPTRTACTVQRRVSNTPLQALALLNDPVHVEAANAFSQRIQSMKEKDDERLKDAFRICTSRFPEPDELNALKELLMTAREAYKTRDIANPEQHAWEDVASALLNLDETISVP